MKARTAAVILVLAVFGLGAPAASAAPGGTYRGETGGEADVKLKVRKNRVVHFESSVHASCGLDDFTLAFAYPPAGKKGASVRIKRDGSFKVVFNGSRRASFNDNKRTLKGKFKRGRVTGTIKVEGICSGETTFTAKR
ncbi:MAG TPA: hypothetical protein VMF31_14270 [Solirubrobacterales bacterium]|nr:hypothetical protein [Solirubrobacterales bacterium]